MNSSIIEITTLFFKILLFIFYLQNINTSILYKFYPYSVLPFPEESDYGLKKEEKEVLVITPD